MSITNPGVKWVCALSYACASAVQGHSLPSLTGEMIPGPSCNHTHLASRSSVPLFRTNRYIKHSILCAYKVWARTLGRDKVGQQLVYFVLYLYFSLTLCHPTPPPLTLTFWSPSCVTERKKLALILAMLELTRVQCGWISSISGWQTVFIIQSVGQLNLDSAASFKLLVQTYHDQSSYSPMDGWKNKNTEGLCVWAEAGHG